MDSSTSVKASVLYAARDVRVTPRALPPPSLGEVQVAILSTGLCGSDLHYFTHFRNGDIPVLEPLSLGHESSARVVALGPDVVDLQVGDLVALEVGLPCGACDLCLGGRYNICPGIRFRSSAKAFPHPQGTLQERINHPAKWCHKLPPNTPPELGALIEPLSVAIHAHTRASTNLTSTPVLIMGAGPVGLLCAAVSKVHGASPVIVADIQRRRLDFALEHGFADAVVEVSRMDARQAASVEGRLAFAKEVAERVRRVEVQGREVGEVNVCFEGTGVESSLQTAIYATRPGGKIMLIGMGNPVQTLPISAAALREVDLVGVFRYANAYPRAIQLVAEPPPEMPDLKALVTHRFRGIDSTPKAFDMAATVEDDEGKLVMKVFVDVGEDGGRGSAS